MATVAAMGIFLPVYIFTILPAPWFRRHRENPQLRAFVAGATAAASGHAAGDSQDGDYRPQGVRRAN